MALVTLAVAKQHLRPPGTIDDTRIARLIEEATSIVLLYIKAEMDEYQATNGDPLETVPPAIRAATLLVLGNLYDNTDGKDMDKDPLSPAVKSLLTFYRMPSIA